MSPASALGLQTDGASLPTGGDGDEDSQLSSTAGVPTAPAKGTAAAAIALDVRPDVSPAADVAPAKPHFVKPVFTVEVDSELKAKHFRPWTITRPHHLTFHLVWLSWLSCQISVFTPAALMPVIRNDLGMTKHEASGSGIAALAGSLISRIALGLIVDPNSLGPRRALPCFLLFIAPAVFCISQVANATGFIIARFFIGFCLGAFVVTQYSSAAMFNVQIVGMTNAAAAGFGNMGAGIAELFMPMIFDSIVAGGVEEYTAWRWCMFIPGGMMMLFPALFMMFAQDLPAGNYRELIASGQLVLNNHKSTKTPAAPVPLKQQLGAYCNYRAWILAFMYMFCFGVELAVNNVMVSYLWDQFNLSMAEAGGYASIFGLMPCVARTFGGWSSDRVARDFGMRGRLWLMFIMMTSAGAFCIGLGNLSGNLQGTIACITLFAFTAQASEGVVYSIVPFVSRRSMGAVSGLVGAGGSAGGVILQAAFFYTGDLTYYAGFQWMGVAIIAIAGLMIPFLHFPPWGSMFQGPTEGVDEEMYYMSEYTAEEVAMGLSNASMKFAYESRSQRGIKSIKSPLGAWSPTGSMRGIKHAVSNVIEGSVRGFRHRPAASTANAEGSQRPQVQVSVVNPQPAPETKRGP